MRETPLLSNQFQNSGYSWRPTVSCVLLTSRLTEECAGWFSNVRRIVDELIVLVDTALADHATHAFAREVATTLHEVKAGDCVEAHLADMVRACSGDWILRLDSDEQLNANWMAGGWRDFLAGDATHFITPRRWIHPAGGYINCVPWWPDPQMRLFRNDPALLTFPQRIHEPTHVAGPGYYLQDFGIDHHVLRLTSRVEREAKVRHYTKLRPELPLGRYYLFEDCEPSTISVADPDGDDASGARASQDFAVVAGA